MSTQNRSVLDDVKGLGQTLTSHAPFYAAVGVSDLVVQQVRQTRTRALQTRDELAGLSVSERAEKAAAGLQQVPQAAIARTMAVASKAAASYEDLATRGEKLVGKIRTQQATTDLRSQAENAVAQTKGAVTTIRRAATSSQRAAWSTVGTARKQAVAVSTSDDVDAAAKTTRTSAKRTATTARKGAASTKRATKAAAKTGK